MNNCSASDSLGTRNDRTAETRERIERAALKCFVAKGFDGTSIREISEEAGVSLGALYVHFDDKEDLAWKIFNNGWNSIAEEMRRRAAGNQAFPVKLTGIVDCLYGRFERDPLLVTYIFSSRHRYFKKIGVHRGDPYMVLRIAIVGAMRRGEIPGGDVDLKNAIVGGAVIQTIDDRTTGRLKTNLTNLVDKTVDICLRALGWTGAAAAAE
jgi:AcrR family transcriptional regulator